MKIQHFMALVVLSLATVPAARAAVLAGPLTNAANAHTYYLLSADTWTASEAEARGLGGHLYFRKAELGAAGCGLSQSK